MGTLGCINDMMRRDKENRELRKVGKERMNETRNRLLGVSGRTSSSKLSSEKLEQIVTESRKRKEWERESFFRGKLMFMVVVAVILLAILLLLFSCPSL